MKICFCVSWYFPASVGGTETYVNALAVFLKARGHTIIILKPGEKDQPAYSYSDIEVMHFYPGKDFSKKMYLGLQPPGLMDFEEKLAGIKPDVVHFHSLTGPSGITVFHVQKARLFTSRVYFTFHLPHLTCATSTFRYLKKHVCQGVADPQMCSACVLVHKGWPEPAAKVAAAISNTLEKSHISVLGNNPVLTALGSAEWIGVRKRQLRQLTEWCDRVICLSSWFYQVLLKNGVPSEKIALIEQGLLMNVENLVAKSRRPVAALHPIRLVFLGRLHPIKGLPLLLSVIQQFNETEYLLDLYGPLEEDYREQLAAVINKKNIHYKGMLPHASVLTVLAQYDAMIVPSTVTEMAPLVLQEAFAAGIPAIASDVEGNAAFVKPGINGWLFKSGSRESLRETLDWLLDHREQLDDIGETISVVRNINDIGQEHLQLYAYR